MIKSASDLAVFANSIVYEKSCAYKKKKKSIRYRYVSNLAEREVCPTSLQTFFSHHHKYHTILIFLSVQVPTSDMYLLSNSAIRLYRMPLSHPSRVIRSSYENSFSLDQKHVDRPIVKFTSLFGLSRPCEFFEYHFRSK